VADAVPRIERATAADVPEILGFIRALADYEHLADQVVATEEALRESLFGARPQAEVVFACSGAERVGFALFFETYSTFLGRKGLYLEDLFVKPEQRGRGHGKALLQFLARTAVERGCGRFEWAALDWNAPAIGFYESLGAVQLLEWTTFRLTGDALLRLARSPLPPEGGRGIG
jgi:GNAT superfamily N-acetyltransferase